MAVKKAKQGVLTYQELIEAVSKGFITSKHPLGEEQIQPASLDLRLGDKAYRLVSSFLPEDKTVMEKLYAPDFYGTDLVMYETDISDGVILEKGHVYLIPLMEELNLPKNIKGRANPKSSTGRLDVFTRIITDKNKRFDDISSGYKGKMYLEVMPRSYTIKVTKGMSLVQLRLSYGEPILNDTELKKLNTKEKLIWSGTKNLKNDDILIQNGMFMSVDLEGEKGSNIIAYKSRKNSHVVDLTKKNHYKIADFWEPIMKNKQGTLILEPEEFYILSSLERIRIPVNYAAEMAPFEAGSGELRTHYAGFFDPGFGYGLKGEVKGTKAVLEVRAHDVPFMIAHGQTFCKLNFEKMTKLPDITYGPKIGSHYQYQGITLSKQFKNGQFKRAKTKRS